MSISNYYDLKSASVSPSQLLLDPNNPRLQLSWTKSFKDTDIECPDLQDTVFQTITKGKHSLNKLINSIKLRGFIKGTNDIVVRRLGTSDKYVVLEGNRRTSAIKYLLAQKEKVSQDVLRSIQTIPLKVFEYHKNKQYTFDDVINNFYGVIHLEGPESWGAMEKARYMLKAYETELFKQTSAKHFTWNREIATYLATQQFNQTLLAFQKTISVFHIFEEMRKLQYEIDSEKYSLLELAITSKQAKSVFEYNSGTLEFSATGMENFSRLCLETNAPITNPKAFNAFAFIVAYGTSYQIDQVLEQRQDPFKIKAKVKARKDSNAFSTQIQELTADLKKIKLNSCGGTKAELQDFQQLRNLVDEYELILKKMCDFGAEEDEVDCPFCGQTLIVTEPDPEVENDYVCCECGESFIIEKE
jgi:hypothetical protein